MHEYVIENYLSVQFMCVFNQQNIANKMISNVIYYVSTSVLFTRLMF